MKHILTHEMVIKRLREDTGKAGSINEFARKTGVERTTVQQMLKYQRKLSPTLLKYYGLETVYRAK